MGGGSGERGVTGELKMMIYNKMTGTIKLQSTTYKSTYCAACQVQVCFEPLFTSIPAVPTFLHIKKNKDLLRGLWPAQER